MSDPTTSKITPSDLQNKFTELKDGVDTAAGGAKDTATKAGIAAAVIFLILAFMLGRRRGRQGKTVVEVRRL